MAPLLGEGYCIDSNGVYRKNKETFKEDCGVW